MEKTDSEVAMFEMISECTETLKRDPNLIYLEGADKFIQRFPKLDPTKGIVETAKKIYKKIIERKL